MMKQKKIFNFSILVLFFTMLFFVWDIVFQWNIEEKEEDFLEISVYEETDQHKAEFKSLTESILWKKISEEDVQKKENILQKIEIIKLQDSHVHEHVEDNSNDENRQLESALDIHYTYVPDDFFARISTDSEDFDWILSWEKFTKLIKDITLSFYEERIDVRWKMKDKSIKFYDPDAMEDDEILGIFIHELSHYIDLYYLERIDWADISNSFYDISWYSTIIMSPWLDQADFVSGYWMTNKYEDFAETLTYYVFHNDDFVVKMQDSDVLVQKYNFIKNVIFWDNSFIWTDFSNSNEVKSYYRDITKIHFSKKNFLQYVQNSI